MREGPEQTPLHIMQYCTAMSKKKKRISECHRRHNKTGDLDVNLVKTGEASET
jgi:hypothetical protein